MIWCDLDGTLAYAVPLPPMSRRAIAPFVDFTVGREGFRAAIRPGALDFLHALRAITDVRLLTFSRREYAEEMCQRLSLGFTAREIVAQSDWWGGFLNPQPLRRESKVAAIDVLVANQTDAMNEAKIGWLGSKARLVVVPDFVGANGDSFGAEWKRYVDKVLTALNDGPRPGAYSHQSSPFRNSLRSPGS